MIRRCVRTLRLQDEIVHQPFVLTKVKLHEIQLSATKLTQNLHIVVGRTYFVIKTYKHHCYLLREREMFILRTERKRERRHFLTVLQLVIHNLYPCQKLTTARSNVEFTLKEGQERVTTVTDFAKPIAISFADFHKILQLLTISLVLPSFKYTGICLQSTVSRLIVQL